MECDRLKKLVKNWYVQVQDESMAPARMVDFMHSHLNDCLVCMADPLAGIEVKRIAEIVLPAAKTPKTVRRDKEPDEIDALNAGADADETEEDEIEEVEDVPADDDDKDIDPDDEEDEDDEI
ncbi:MAG: hypothetical protein RQ753_08075 [Desulfurivibrionaceae bacterium]|nr:hypothetical protein [Desulfobulbales bacterium]MDT8335641.1 hypothetical protein [Desulfurivibrionaceae bacterium]